jgi:hypothetical protein
VFLIRAARISIKTIPNTHQIVSKASQALALACIRMKGNRGITRASARTHHEAVVEAGEDGAGAGEGDGGELEVAEVAGEGLHDDVEAGSCAK